MKKLTLCFALILSISGTAAAAMDGGLFTKANDLYSKGQYEQAAAAYESILARGNAGADVNFNLGNAYYKTQRYGEAAACFERAARLAPRDPDIRFNLDFLRTIIKEPAEQFPEILVSYLNNLVTLNELTVLCSFFWFLLIFGVIFYIITKRQSVLLLNIASALAVIVFSGWLFIKIDREVLSREAVIVMSPAEVRNGPGTENSVGFTLPEGRKVMVIGAKDDWAAVGLKSEGLKGWIEKKYLEEI